MPGDPRFHAMLKEMGDLHDLKQEGYGSEGDPFANFHTMSRFGIHPWQYVVGRIEEKMQRLASVMTREHSGVDEVEELRDIAVLAAIGKVLFEEEVNNGTK